MTIVERAQRTVEPEKTRLDGLFEEHVEAVYAYAVRRTNSSAIAEDIASEAFSEAFRRPDRIPNEDPLPWLLGIARRKIADHFRRINSRREVALVAEILSRNTSAVGLLLKDEEAVQLRILVDELPADQREALLLHYVEGFTAKQISVTMGRSPFAVNSLLQRARRQMQRKGQDYFASDESKP